MQRWICNTRRPRRACQVGSDELRPIRQSTEYAAPDGHPNEVEKKNMGESIHTVKGRGPGVREHPVQKPRGDGGGTREETGRQKEETHHIQSPESVNDRGLVNSITREELNEPRESWRMGVGKVIRQLPARCRPCRKAPRARNERGKPDRGEPEPRRYVMPPSDGEMRV